MQSRDHMNVSSGSERPVRADGRKEGFSVKTNHYSRVLTTQVATRPGGCCDTRSFRI